MILPLRSAAFSLFNPSWGKHRKPELWNLTDLCLRAATLRDCPICQARAQGCSLVPLARIKKKLTVVQPPGNWQVVASSGVDSMLGSQKVVLQSLPIVQIGMDEDRPCLTTLTTDDVFVVYENVGGMRM